MCSHPTCEAVTASFGIGEIGSAVSVSEIRLAGRAVQVAQRSLSASTAAGMRSALAIFGLFSRRGANLLEVGLRYL